MKLLSAISTVLLVTTTKTSSAQLSCPTDPTSYKVVDVPYGDGTAWDDDAWAGDEWTDDGHGKPSFEYAIVHDESVDGTDPSILCGKMTSNHLGMIAFGISPAGVMIGGEAIIGLPANSTVLKYNLGAKSVAGVTPMSPEKQTLLSSSITQDLVANTTTMEFAKILVEDGEHPITPNVPNTFLWALGSTDELGYHGGDKSPFTVVLEDGLATPAPTPGPLVPEDSIDVGPVGIPGSSTQGAEDSPPGSWVVKGSGYDIWNSYDQFHYMYFNHTGDVTVTCRVNSFTGSTNGWRKGGIMVRDNIGERSAHSMLQLTGWGIANQSRQNEASGSISVHESYDLAGVWLRMTRVGNVITSYVKRDGEFDYMMYNSVEVTLSDDIKVGIAVTSHDNSQLAELDISHLEITSDVYTLGDSNLVVNEVGDTGTNLRAQQTSEGVWSISAGGDIGGTADSLGFFDGAQTGNIIAEMHLEKLQRRNNDSKGGLMIRASHEVDSPHVSLLVQSGTGVTMFSRATTGGLTTSKNVGVMLEDIDLRLEKTGNTVKCLYKQHTNGVNNWYLLGEATADFNSTYYVGQAVASAEIGQYSKLTSGLVTVSPLTGEL